MGCCTKLSIMKIKNGMWLLLLATSVVTAEVYKWTDDQGNVHYGDLPPGQVAAEPMRLPGLSTYKNRPVASAPAEPTEQPAAFAGYSKLAIVQPEADGTVRDNAGNVTVAVELAPPLQEGHRMMVLLDGRVIGEPYPGTGAKLSGVNRGQHQLQVQIVDQQGKMLTQSASQTFFMRQASINKAPNP